MAVTTRCIVRKTFSVLSVLVLLSLGSQVQGAPIFTEDFNSISGSLSATQYDTGFSFGPNITVSGWTDAGGNAAHVVDLSHPADTNYAPMIFNGNGSFASNTLTLTTGIAANDSGVNYEVSFLVSPTIGGAATSGAEANDGLVIDVLRGDDSVLASYSTAQRGWTGAHDLQSESFTFLGDGTGDIRFSISSQQTMTSDHSGIIDDLSVSIVPVGQVPEPASIAIWTILGLCLAGYGYRRRRKQ